ncbi:hypothetical protein BDN72DRAFT_829789 [Pluteus cervinus]|uniref:Uncharacterized protein n=1 Tax=Pluteus cervinus TaxID=181527 RepID=A0ACD3BFJ4_9AGAR|nr:hypothetical protein BDN72DRAFT_829789 [Pluteus cervinus]
MSTIASRNWTGVRVFIWDTTAQVLYGTVQESRRLDDGTQVVDILADSGRMFKLPLAAVTIVRDEHSNLPVVIPQRL